MQNLKGMRYPLEVILVCIRWYVAYPLSYRHLEEMMAERGVSVDHVLARPADLTDRRAWFVLLFAYGIGLHRASRCRGWRVDAAPD